MRIESPRLPLPTGLVVVWTKEAIGLVASLGVGSNQAAVWQDARRCYRGCPARYIGIRGLGNPTVVQQVEYERGGCEEHSWSVRARVLFDSPNEIGDKRLNQRAVLVSGDTRATHPQPAPQGTTSHAVTPFSLVAHRYLPKARTFCGRAQAASRAAAAALVVARQARRRSAKRGRIDPPPLRSRSVGAVSTTPLTANR